MQRSTRSASGLSPDSAPIPVGGQVIASAGPHSTDSPVTWASADCGSSLSLNTASRVREIRSCLAYASGNADRCTRWAATVTAMFSQPRTCFSPGMV